MNAKREIRPNDVCRKEEERYDRLLMEKTVRNDKWFEGFGMICWKNQSETRHEKTNFAKSMGQREI